MHQASRWGSQPAAGVYATTALIGDFDASARSSRRGGRGKFRSVCEYGISPHSLHFIRRLALRAKGARARDSTVYGGSSTSAKSFFVHHTQQLAAAAQVGDAKGIRKKITEMKMRLIKVALKATGRG